MIDLKKYYKIPFADHDNGWNGTHCWGFFRLFLFEEKGIEVLDYKRGGDILSQACEKAHEEYIKVEESAIQPFDAILFTGVNEIPVHIGVCIGGGKFIHCLLNVGVCVSKIDLWKNKVVGFYRHKGLVK